MILKEKDNISAEEAELIHVLAAKIADQTAYCGPLKIMSIDGKKSETTCIHGFEHSKATKVIEDMIWDFLLKED